MSPILNIILLATVVTVLLVLGWWLLIASEGVYLGRRVVIWLYDLYAHRYDAVKNYYSEYEQMYLAMPIMQAIGPQKNPLMLDVATGTGRLPLAMARHPDFDGFTIGVDLSRQMLHFATRYIFPYEHRAAFIWRQAEELPFPDNTFDVVTCLEALEFMTDPEAVLRELIRVLSPGGVLLISQRINTKLMPGKTWDSGKLIQLLNEGGIENARAQIWQVDYRKVWGRKKGEPKFVGVRPVSDVMRCPHCHQTSLQLHEESKWVCENCGAAIPVGNDGVIELRRVTKKR